MLLEMSAECYICRLYLLDKKKEEQGQKPFTATSVVHFENARKQCGCRQREKKITSIEQQEGLQGY